MSYAPPHPSPHPIRPRLIIHGGAGNILPSNLPPTDHHAFTTALLHILALTHAYQTTTPLPTALDAATHAVTLLENCPLFNSGRGAVFTRDGTNELEASVMVSRGLKKRGVGVMGLSRVRNPVQLARQMLLRGETDLDSGNGEHRGPMAADEEGVSVKASGAQGHSQLFGPGAERLAKEWGVDLVEPSYFFTQKRWDEHVAGLEREKRGGCATWDADAFVSQGTCGAVALDAEGVVCAATSTGGMTNKLAGRVGDTPTLGAGFWAEEWEGVVRGEGSGAVVELEGALRGVLADCFPGWGGYGYLPLREGVPRGGDTVVRAMGMSGTGNGDSFLRVNAVRTVSAIAKYRGDGSTTSLGEALREVTGPGGELQQSAGKRWKKTGEGEGGMIGIECAVVKGPDGEVRGTRAYVLAEYNCGGMFRATVNENGKAVARVWNEGQYEGLEGYENEGKEYDPRDLKGEKAC
ncbi:hypothetical protein VF21_06634 [Pseudogymnoascus sp. 05NY08]|nr:hypothetical protein VF21_06634 [Pseudogymnoascus sp. 05NY08]